MKLENVLLIGHKKIARIMRAVFYLTLDFYSIMVYNYIVVEKRTQKEQKCPALNFSLLSKMTLTK